MSLKYKHQDQEHKKEERRSMIEKEEAENEISFGRGGIHKLGKQMMSFKKKKRSSTVDPNEIEELNDGGDGWFDLMAKKRGFAAIR